MASRGQRQLSHNRVCFRSSYSETRLRGSTSQMCLRKILAIITTVPPPLAAASPPFSGLESKDSLSDENQGSGRFDVNVGFCSSAPEPKESLEAGASGMSSSSSTTVLDCGSFKVNLEDGCSDRVENDEENGNGVSGSSHVKTEEAEKSLALLIEAAKLIFGEFEDCDEPESRRQNASLDSELKKGEVEADIEADGRKLTRPQSSCFAAAEMGGELEEAPPYPALRSKRERSRVLPCKYRDSVLEPLTRPSRLRSSIPSSKRGRR